MQQPQKNDPNSMKHGKFKKTVMGLGCALAASGSLSAASFVLPGTQMTVGVDDSGGLIDAAFTAGIIPAWRPAVDYLRPGRPFQFYSIGASGQWLDAGYDPDNNFGASTANTSAGSILSATTTGTFGDLSFTQLLWFGVSDTTIRYKIIFENTGPNILTDVVYAVGLDPDQEYDLLGVFETFNTIPNADTVLATGTTFGDWIQISSYDPLSHVPSVSFNWDTDPYLLFNTPPNDVGYNDSAINMAFWIGDMAPGQVVTFGYDISIGTVIPEPRDYAILSGLGLLGLAAYRRFRK